MAFVVTRFSYHNSDTQSATDLHCITTLKSHLSVKGLKVIRRKTISSLHSVVYVVPESSYNAHSMHDYCFYCCVGVLVSHHPNIYRFITLTQVISNDRFLFRCGCREDKNLHHLHLVRKLTALGVCFLRLKKQVTKGFVTVVQYRYYSG